MKQVLFEHRSGKFCNNPNECRGRTSTPLTHKQYLTRKECIMDWVNNDDEGLVLPDNKEEKDEWLFKRNPNGPFV